MRVKRRRVNGFKPGEEGTMQGVERRGGTERRRPYGRCIGKATKPHGLCKHRGTAMSCLALYTEVGYIIILVQLDLD